MCFSGKSSGPGLLAEDFPCEMLGRSWWFWPGTRRDESVGEAISDVVALGLFRLIVSVTNYSLGFKYVPENTHPRSL